VLLSSESGFFINSAFWVRSLPESERGPTRRVLEDLQPFFEEIELPFQLRDVGTPDELYVALRSLAAPGVKPILQLDMHGTKEGLVLARDGAIAPWRRVVPLLRDINVASGGNLCVIAGVCYAFHSLREASILQPSPVNILIAPDTEVRTGILEDNLFGFYKALFSGLDIGRAQQAHLHDPFKLFNAERFFVISLCKYIRNACKGKGAAERREKLLTDVLLTGRARTSQNMRAIRKQIKRSVKPDEAALDKYAQTFLLGRPCPFSIEQLEEAVAAA
jgi:hypothetical protein